MKTLNLKITFTYIIATLLLQGCMPQNNRSIDSDDSEQTTDTPTFNDDLNYWTNTGVESYSTVTIFDDFNRVLTIRGKLIDHYIRNNNRYTPECFVTQYTSSYENKIMALAAFPSTMTNSSGATEYYYRLEPNNSASNIGFCQTAGIINQLASALPGYSIAYSLDSLCSSCTYNEMRGTLSQFYTSSGISISTINISYLSIDIQVSSGDSSSSSIPGCSSSNYCIGLGYDCCSEDNQCIIDNTLKPDAETHDDYLFAVSAEANLPGSYRNWPSIYNVCPITIVATPTATPSVDPEVVFDDHLQRLKELHECTSPQYAEQSICTISYEDVTTNGLTTFATSSDDRNFNNTYTGEPLSYGVGVTALPDHSVEEIIYAGVYLYKDRAFTGIGSIQITGGNDSIASTDFVTLTNLSYTPSTSAPNDTLKIRFKVDGSCTVVSDDITKCYKLYTQGQNLGQIDDHYPSSNQFLIPGYANLSKTIKVEVDDDFTTKWTLFNVANPYIQFTNSVYDNQVVKITFYVDTSGGLNQVTKARTLALDEINTLCNCGGPYCTLQPKTVDQNNVETIVDYTCVYPQADTTEAPLYQEVYIDSKTAAHRLFDDGGQSQEEMDSSITQEGTAFEYTNDDLLKPNNISSYIGFNEIYGSFTMKGSSAVAAKELRVETGTTYDIYTNSGNFASCNNCGTDYYSQLVQLFPENFFYSGGGYMPDSVSTNRSNLSSSFPYRADDLIFGRACWLPASMIPWTHQDFADSQYQRLKRLQAQHFLFANGYQRDWFGFDYGAVIGSFDGVFWFAIGNKRRITASSNRLYLAVNAYFGDLTTKSSYHVTIQDATLNPTLGTEATSDYDSDGAQCRKYHVCNSDSDCASQLGWDYVCQTITGVKSLWPSFDSSGNELPEIDDNLLSIFSRIGSAGGGTKRCVYRGRGAPCHPDYQSYSSNPEDTYARSSKLGLLGCSSNNYCQEFNSGGSDVSEFNDRIARYGYSVGYVNGVNGTSEHTFGKGAPIIGRPLKFNGDQSILSDTKSNLSSNNVTAICIPGRNPSVTNFTNSNQTSPSLQNQGDQVLGIGMTLTSLNSYDEKYLNSCSIFSESGNYVAFDGSFAGADLMDDNDLTILAATQVLPSNAIALFQDNSTDVFGDYQILDNFLGDKIDKKIIQENSCLRAPGSVCHTDMDCAPSSIITQMTSQIDASSSSYINSYELKFWQEGLVCSQKEPKVVDYAPNPDYDLTLNRCCRETGNVLTIGSQANISNAANGTESDLANQDTFTVDFADVLGTSVALNDSTRYSRMSTAHSLMSEKPGDYPQLRYIQADPSSSSSDTANISILENQFNTFSYIASNTCCSGNWIRNFHKEDNGGGHVWGPDKAQLIDKSNFKCVNWTSCGGVGEPSCGTPFTCDHTLGDAQDSDCGVRDISSSEGKRVFEFMNSLEMLGIPQVKVPSIAFSQTYCRSNPDDQTAPASVTAIPETILSAAEPEYGTSGADGYLSAIDENNFDDLKKRFSADEITCCIPAGDALPDGSDASDCCSGYSSNGLCTLKDYSNVSLYFNRYISSAANGLAESLFDEDTGFIKDTDVVVQLACTLNVCKDGVVAKGIAHSRITVAGAEDPDIEDRKKNFVDRNGIECSYSEYYDAGLRWNNDVYCVPASIIDAVGSDDSCDFEIYSCGSLN